MTRARRPLAAVAGLALAALVTLPTGAAGQEPEPDCNAWGCIEWDTQPGATFTGSQRLSGRLVPADPSVTVTDVVILMKRLGDANPPATTCRSQESLDHHLRDAEEPIPTSTTLPDDPGQAFVLPVVPECNGRYHVSLTVVGRRPNQDPCSDPAPLACTVFELGDHTAPGDAVRVALSPPDVAATSVAIAADRTVTVSWQPPSGYTAAGATPSPPDFIGYVVQRSTDGGTTFSRRANLAPTVSSFAETLGPSDPAGTYMYRVLAVRYGATASEFTIAAGGATAVARLDVAAPPTSAPPTSARPPTSGGPGRPTNDAAPTVLGTIPSTTIDEGFGEIVYDDVEPGEEEAVVPPDADSLLDFASPGAGLLIPFAIAECLAVWALHLRYLARRVDAGV